MTCRRFLCRPTLNLPIYSMLCWPLRGIYLAGKEAHKNWIKRPARYIQPYVKTNKKRANSAFCAQLGTMPPSPRAPAVDVGPVRRD